MFITRSRMQQAPFWPNRLISDKNFKIVTTLHGTDITLLGSDPSFLKITRFSIEQSTGVTAVSEYLKKETYRVFETKKEIEVIPNFIPFSISMPVNRDELRNKFAAPDEHIVTHISNFRPIKRVTDIVPTIQKVLEHAKVKMLMVGDGPERFKTEEQCRQLGLCDHVIFLGKQENIQDILSISDMMLLPSASESFGLAALEAMAYGIPCVTTNTGGLPEVNINGKTGYTLDIGDIDGFADSILNIIKDRELAKYLGQNAAKIARDNFSAEKIIPQYIDYYKKVLLA